MTRAGVDRLVWGEVEAGLSGARIGAVVHPASVTEAFVPTVHALVGAGMDVRALFGPQHGARGEKQDNMIESAHHIDPTTGLTVFSLYGDVRQPTQEMLDGLDALLFDLQDVGTRVYTFIWTMALAMEACGRQGVRFIVLDRPNPIGGELREGPLLDDGFESFVGLHPLPLRHGLTCGEVARWLVRERGISCELTVIPCSGWRRTDWWEDTDLPWVMPSPNLPTPDSCAVYAGTVLMEGTNLSEGRGTTRPFELIGAPYVAGTALSAKLTEADLPGVVARPCHFEPTFNKHAGELCGGVQLHVTDRTSFEPVRTAVSVLAAVHSQHPDDFEWRPPPYEYEHTLMPIDILWGSDRLRHAVEARSTEDALADEASRLAEFEEEVAPSLIYGRD